tara:strand:- start:332 stop:649 length:318 start_codon:yes stop_codon:yes gene_type:complete
MSIRFQISKTIPGTTNVEQLCQQLINEIERDNPSKHAVYILKEGEVRDESNALMAVASYAVRAPYVADRVYVAMTSPAKSSRKRTADGANELVFAAVAYDYHSNS